MSTRTPEELRAATDEVYSQMASQPKRRGFIPVPPKFAIDTLVCTDAHCSNRRCSCRRTAR